MGYDRDKQGQGGFVLIGVLVVIGVLAGGHALMMLSGPKPPAASEFGLGPRTSANGLYRATLAPTEPLRTRALLSFNVVIVDRNDKPVDDAVITIGGGMPQHGHGLPTKPRVTGRDGHGGYVIEGVRFSMGGWWEFTLSITTPAGTDVVTFNFKL